MKKMITSLLLFFTVAIAFAKPTDWMYLVTNDQFGVINKTSTYQDLINLFGKEKLKEETVSEPEGEGEFKVTMVYKGTPLEMMIYWEEKKWHKKIASVECTQPKSPYYTKDNIKIGSNLTTLVKINKAPVTFGGFGWDYGGTITSFNKGTLAKSKVYFMLDWDGGSDTTLLGDGSFTSNMPKVVKRAAKVLVVSMQVNWAE